MPAPSGLQPNARDTIRIWHEALASGDLSALPELASDQVVFRSPAVFTPFSGRQAFVFIIHMVYEIFEDFHYLRQFATDDGSGAVPHARVGSLAELVELLCPGGPAP